MELHEFGVEDLGPGHPGQRQLVGGVPRPQVVRLRTAGMASEGDGPAVGQLDEAVNHEWFWSLRPPCHRTLEPDVYVDAVRLRLLRR